MPTVTFSPADGSIAPVPVSKTVTVGSPYGTLATVTRPGYTFVRWDNNYYGIPPSPVTSSTTVTNASDHTLYAIWSMNTQYTITFFAWEGGETVRTQAIPLGAAYGYPSGSLPSASSRVGYTFQYWFMVQPVSRIVTADLATDQTQDHNVIGIYTANDYTVSFDAQGGDAQDDITVTYDSAYGTLPTPSRAGYVFDGWFTAASGGTEVTAATTVSTASNHTLYAQWSAATYTVSFDGQGGSSESPITVTYGSTYGTLPTPTRSGYTFDGWFTEAAGGGTQITSATTVSITADQTLYADWTLAEYTVSFDSQGGTAADSITVTAGGTYGTLPTTTRTGYTFGGWYTAASGGTLVTAATTVTASADHTLYAVWTANTYTVSFDADGGSSSSSITVTYGQAYGSLPTSTRSGYVFSGWYTAADGSGSAVSSTTVMATAENHTLTAYWIFASDQLRCYRTGAGSTGAAQSAADMSRGNYRSSTEVESFGICLADSIPGLRVRFASGANGEGNGTLTAVTSGTVAWTPPGGTQGTVVEIASGETRVVAGADASKFVRVERTSVTDLAGTMTVRLERLVNNVIGGSNVSDADRQAGLWAYRCVALYNAGTTALSDVEVYGNGLSVGVETPLDSPSVGHATDRTIGPESNGVALTFASGSWVSAGSIAPGCWLAVWVRRRTAAGASASAMETNTLRWRHTGAAVTGEASGSYRIADDSLARYELYRGAETEPDFSASPWETFSSLPHTTAALTYPEDWYLCTRRRNAYDLVSGNIASTLIRLGADGSQIAQLPTAPEEVSLTALLDGSARLAARYYSMPDDGADGAADTWRIYLTTDGSDPDPATDTPTDVAFWDSDGVPALEWDSAVYSAGTEVRVLLRTYRSSDGAESDNTGVLSCTITATGLGAPALGCGWGLDETATVTSVWSEGAARLDLVSPPELLRWYIDGVLVGGVSGSGVFALKGAVRELAFSADVELSDYVEYSGGVIRFGALVGSVIQRVAELDGNGRLQVWRVQSHSGWPLVVSGGLSGYYEWNAAAGGLDLTADLSRAYVRFLAGASGGVSQATLQVREVRENVL